MCNQAINRSTAYLSTEGSRLNSVVRCECSRNSCLRNVLTLHRCDTTRLGLCCNIFAHFCSNVGCSRTDIAFPFGGRNQRRPSAATNSKLQHKSKVMAICAACVVMAKSREALSSASLKVLRRDSFSGAASRRRFSHRKAHGFLPDSATVITFIPQCTVAGGVVENG